jgi:hypothetical protein
MASSTEWLAAGGGADRTAVALALALLLALAQVTGKRSATATTAASFRGGSGGPAAALLGKCALPPSPVVGSKQCGGRLSQRPLAKRRTSRISGCKVEDGLRCA